MHWTEFQSRTNFSRRGVDFVFFISILKKDFATVNSMLPKIVYMVATFCSQYTYIHTLAPPPPVRSRNFFKPSSIILLINDAVPRHSSQLKIQRRLYLLSAKKILLAQTVVAFWFGPKVDIVAYWLTESNKWIKQNMNSHPLLRSGEEYVANVGSVITAILSQVNTWSEYQALERLNHRSN